MLGADNSSVAEVDALADAIKTNTRTRVEHLETELQNGASTAQTESDVKQLEDQIRNDIRSAREEVNRRFDRIEEFMASKKPSDSDPNYIILLQRYLSFLQSANRVVDTIRTLITNIFTKLWELITTVFGWIRDAVKYVYNKVKSGAMWTGGKVCNGAAWIKDKIREGFQNFLDVFY